MSNQKKQLLTEAAGPNKDSLVKSTAFMTAEAQKRNILPSEPAPAVETKEDEPKKILGMQIPVFVGASGGTLIILTICAAYAYKKLKTK